MKARHDVRIVYPDFSLIQAPENRFVIQPRNYDQRYDPGLPLVNANLEAPEWPRFHDEMNFIFSSEANRHGTHDEFAHCDQAVTNIAKQTREISCCIGETLLRVSMYVNPTQTLHGEAVHMVRILRETSFSGTSGYQTTDAMTYNVRAKSLQDFQAGDYLWLKLLQNVVFQESDRAVRAAESQFYYLGLTYPNHPWKAPRPPNYERCLTPPAFEVYQNLDRVQMCGICLEGYNHADGVCLNCHPEHHFHPNCLSASFGLQVQRPDDAICPICRATVFRGDDLIFLKRGTRGKGYLPDIRYSAWENFERSCSDLDEKFVASRCGEKLTVSKAEMIDAFRCLIQGALLEPDDSTPSAIQPVRHMFMPLLCQLFTEEVTQLDGQEHLLVYIYEQLTRNIVALFKREYLSSNLPRYLSPDGVYLLSNGDDDHWQVTIGPQLNGWIRWIMSRVINYCLLRRCRCTPGWEHLHEARTFFNPDQIHMRMSNAGIGEQLLVTPPVQMRARMTGQ